MEANLGTIILFYSVAISQASLIYYFNYIQELSLQCTYIAHFFTHYKYTYMDTYVQLENFLLCSLVMFAFQFPSFTPTFLLLPRLVHLLAKKSQKPNDTLCPKRNNYGRVVYSIYIHVSNWLRRQHSHKHW